MTKVRHPNQGEHLIGIIVGGDSEDPASDKGGGARVFFPQLYNGNKIKFTDLPFARMLGTGTQHANHSSSAPPERGTVVLATKDGGPGQSGSGFATIMGVLPNTILKGMGVPGGRDLKNFFEEAVNHKTDKKAPPKSLKTDNRNGAEIRGVQDTQTWSHSLTKGIPSTASLWPMAGIHLPPVSGVATAIEHSTSILSGSMLGSLPGSAMSLGKMFSMLSSSGALNQVLSSLPPEMQDAMNSISNLTTQVELSSGFGFAVSGRVDETTFLANAVKLLSGAQSIADIVDSMTRLQTDTTLHGLDKLAAVKIPISGPFGKTVLELDASGTVKSTINLNSIVANSNTINVTSNVSTSRPQTEDEQNAAEYIQKILGFANMLNSPEQAFASSGSNLFGGSATRMFDMFNRMNSGATSHMKDLIETVNTGSTATNNIKPLADLVFKGGNILSGKGFS